MKKHVFPTAIVIAAWCLIICSFNSCSSKITTPDPEFARYIHAFTYGNVSPESYIQIELAQDMPAVELNSEVKEKLFSLSPSVGGKTYWINSSTIRFVPDAGALKPGKEYTVNFLLNKLLQVDKKFRKFSFNIRVNEQKFSALALPFSPVNSSTPEWNAVDLELKLANSASPEMVGQMIDLKNTNKEAAVKVTPVNSTLFRITIDSLLRTNEEKKYEIEIKGAPIGVRKTTKHTILIPPLSTINFKVFDVRLIQNADQHIRITFTDPISQLQDITGLISIPEAANFTFQTDKNVVKIYPETMPENKLTLQINQGIQNITGLKLDKNYTYNLSVEGTKPEIAFEKSGNILPNSEQLVLPFKAVNLWAVDVKVIKIYQNNILYFLQTNTLSENSQNEIRRFGRLIKKIRIRLDEDKTMDLSRWNNFSIDLSPMIKKDPGAIYLVQLSMKQDYSLYRCNGNAPVQPLITPMKSFDDDTADAEEMNKWDEHYADYYEDTDWENYNWDERDDPCKPSYYMNSTRRAETMVMASNMGIIAKSGDNGKITVAVTDILTTSPLSGATVKVFNYQLQQTATAKTNADGFAEIEYGKTKPFVVTASKGKDIGYLEVKDELSLSLSNFDVSGKEIRKGLKGYLYGERGVWRPGDTIHLTFILEDKNQKLPNGHPVSLEIFTPTRQFYSRQVKTEGINGFYTFNIPISPTGQTGTWQAYVKVGGTNFYKGLRVETIKPNRLKVRLETDTIIDAGKGVVSGILTSQWLHGAPAANLKADVELTLSKTDKPFRNFTNYSFNNPLVNFESGKHMIFQGVLSQSGTAIVNSKIPIAETAPGILQGSILSRVFETGGDMSFYSQTVYYSPYSSYVGIKSPATRENEFLETDKNLVFDVVTLNAKGIKLNRKVDYKIYKLEWSWWWNTSEENLGSYVNNTAVRPLTMGSVVTTGGAAKINFQVDYPDWGRYLILAKDTESGHTTGTVFYVDWPASRGRSSKTDPNGLTMLSFSTDKKEYSVGEKATVTIPKSSEGRVLISIENGSHIIQREWVKTSPDSDSKYSFRVTDEMNPNFYVFATLLQPHSQQNNDLPIRMYGVVNVSVDNKNSKLTPIIAMPGELRPEKEFTVSVYEQSKKPMTYTLAIVDEGLLDLTSFKTPNAWNEFYAREAIGVRTWDLFDRVLGARTEMLGPLLSIGGDEALKASSDKVNRFKPVVKFIGPFTLKSGETKSHKIKLPAYVGSVRVMVVAGGNGAYGSADKSVQVTSALMTLTTLPRVLGPNEEVFLPVNVFVTDKKVKNVTVSIKTNGMLKPADGVSKTVSFDKPGDKVLFFRLKADKKTGEEHISIKSSGGGESFSENIDIGIRNPNPPHIISKSALVDSKGKVLLSLHSDNTGPNDWAKLEISRLPGINFNKNLQYLLNYPHACTEQITSQGFPLLFISDFTRQTDEEKKRNSEKVDEIIRILSSRQLPDGGFMYWSGDHYASEWVSTYAGHFLTEARQKGFEVSEVVLSKWVQFQQKLARNWTPTNPYRNYYSLSMPQLQQAYRLYSLVRAENTESGAMNRLRELKDLSIQARWQLAAAYALTGKKDVANELIFNQNTRIENYTFNNDTYGTPARDQAIMMETYLLLGQTEKAMALASDVSKALSGDYISTQTAAFGLVAMQKLAEKMGKGNINVSWTMNGNKMNQINTPQVFHQVNLKPSENLTVEIVNQGQAKVFVRMTALTQPLDASNFPSDEQTGESSLRLTASYKDVNGNPMDIKSLKQGQEFTAEVSVQNNNIQDFTDLALVQIFPSGWEIFNERMMHVNSSAGEASFSYRDIRDDRILTYFNLGAGQSKSFSVRLQAAYRGTFFHPSISCQAMYAPGEQARTPAAWVKVE